MVARILNIFTLKEEPLITLLHYIDKLSGKPISGGFRDSVDNYLTEWVLSGVVNRDWNEVMANPLFHSNPQDLVKLNRYEILRTDRNFVRLNIDQNLRKSYISHLNTVQAGRDFYSVKVALLRALKSSEGDSRTLADDVMSRLRLLHAKYGLDRSFSPWAEIHKAASSNWPLAGTGFIGFDIFLVVVNECFKRNPVDSEVLDLETIFVRLSSASF